MGAGHTEDAANDANDREASQGKAARVDASEADEETAALKELSEETCGAVGNIANRQSNWVNEDGGVSFDALV